MDKIKQLLEKLKTEVDRFNDKHTGFKEIGEILDEAAIYLDDISHELNGDGFCEECGEWYTQTQTDADADEYFLCYECMQEIAEDVWQKQYQSDSIPFDEL